MAAATVTHPMLIPPEEREALILRHMAVVDHIANRLMAMGQPANVERDDIVQDGYCEMIRTIDATPCPNGIDLTGRIAANVRRTMVRRLVKLTGGAPPTESLEYDDGDERPIPDDGPVSGLVSETPDLQTLDYDLRRAMSVLDWRQIELLWGRYITGLSEDTLAEQLGVSQPRVCQLIHAALSDLRRVIKQIERLGEYGGRWVEPRQHTSQVVEQPALF